MKNRKISAAFTMAMPSATTTLNGPRLRKFAPTVNANSPISARKVFT